MSFPFLPSSASGQTTAMLGASADIAAFVERNADELLWVCSVTGGHNGRAAATDLVDTVLSRPDDIDTIQDLITILRDTLLEAPWTAGPAGPSGRPDLDAARRWIGARLDEFAARQQ